MIYTDKKIVKIAVVSILVLSIAFIKMYPDNKRDVSQRIYAILDKYRITYDIDAYSVDKSASTASIEVNGVSECIDMIYTYVKANKPLLMVLIGFPFKSANKEQKVISDLPDMAERKSLEYIHQMLQEISEIYCPGVRLDIFCDGAFFAPYLGISDDQVIQYEKNLKQLARDLPYIHFYTSAELMHDFFPHAQPEHLHILREYIDLHYSPTYEEFRKRVTQIPQPVVQRLGLEYEHEAGRALLQNISLYELLYQLLSREERMRSFISHIFSDVGCYGNRFRLTVHFSKDLSKKFGIKTSPRSAIAPYHGALVKEHGFWSIQFVKDINKDHYILKSRTVNEVPCPYFKAIL